MIPRLVFRTVRLEQIVVNANDPRSLVRFWAALLDTEPVDRAHGWSHVEPATAPRMSFQPVPEGKTGRNRLHLDFEVDDIEAAVAKALELGATREGAVRTDEQGSFQVMHDPEGNEFCFVQ